MDQKERFDFISQRVKDRPLNKRKLMKKTLITVTMAAIFGLIASITFFLLQPVLNNWLHPEEQIETIEIPVAEDEVLPEEMVVHEGEMTEPDRDVIDTLKNEIQMGTQEYQEMYQSIYETVTALQPAMVTVTGVSKQMDWFNDPYESANQAVGFIFAQNNSEILIFVETEAILGEKKIEVTFVDGRKVTAYIKGTDYNTGLSVVAVSKSSVVRSTQDVIHTIPLGSSKKEGLLASPVIALGNPLGKNSVIYGMITSTDEMISMIDANYELLTTDIYGSPGAEGVLVDVNGKVIGIIYQKKNADSNKNLISALGITELKSVLQRMGNGFPNTYMGLNITDVPKNIHEVKEVPMGAYVTGISMDSPAMEAGIQSGDVIVQIDRNSISNASDLKKVLEDSKPGELKEVTMMRQGPEGRYKSVRIRLTTGELK